MQPVPSWPLYSIGHSNHSAAMLCRLLGAAGIRQLFDVRRFPISRRWPQFNLMPLQQALQTVGISYEHVPTLGGRRSELHTFSERSAGLDDTGLRSYAEHARSHEFGAALARLLEQARAAPSVMLCAEADFRRCHRQIIQDYALAAGIAVLHLEADGGSEQGQLHALAVVNPDGSVDYPARQAGLF